MNVVKSLPTHIFQLELQSSQCSQAVPVTCFGGVVKNVFLPIKFKDLKIYMASRENDISVFALVLGSGNSVPDCDGGGEEDLMMLSSHLRWGQVSLLFTAV